MPVAGGEPKPSVVVLPPFEVAVVWTMRRTPSQAGQMRRRESRWNKIERMRSWYLKNPSTSPIARRLSNWRRKGRIPTVYPFREFVEVGGLMAYSIDQAEIYRRLANLIDKILRGANPGDIPFYQPTKFELSVNLKTAKSARPRNASDAARPRR
jgi:ABC transporter substrate binding protein